MRRIYNSNNFFTLGIIFASAFPASVRITNKTKSYKVATSIAQRKLEQLRTMNYQSLTQPLLYSVGIIDADQASSPYSFTDVDSIGSQLAKGQGSIAITDISSSVKQVKITISWNSIAENVP